MAVVINYAVEMYGILKVAREVVADQNFAAKEKLWIVKDLRKSLPARQMCGNCADTHDLISTIMANHVEALLNDASKQSASKSTVFDSGPAPVAEAKEVGPVAAKAAPKAKANSRRKKAPRTKN